MTPAETLAALNRQFTETQQLKARAEAAREVAAQNEADARAKLTHMGVNPDTAEQELEALNAELARKIEAFSEQLKAEQLAYQEVLNASKAVGA